ncbi:MAG: hypothetical protein JSV18_00800 [Candidatus Bathyarchaeota archaeon]|nr:MAG: hypothetical protein JSV18_00800 [Candidatus Bathyarchaeota archaeon]
MQLLDVLTLNQEPQTRGELTETIKEALAYFPEQMWEGVNYLGNINIDHHLRIKSREELHGAFIVNGLVEKLRELKRLLDIRELLLALTQDPVIITYYHYELNRFRRIINLVRDYVAKDVGMISLFETEDETAVRIAAHGLGHNQGLSHHQEPVGLMYVGLLDGSPIIKNGFCDDCKTKLESTLA